MTTIEKPTGGAVVKPRANARLEQFAALYDAAKAKSEAADKELKAITDAIKVELANAAPGETSIDLVTDSLRQPLRLLAVTSMRVDSSKLKENEPEIYERYTKPQTVWQLRRVAG